MGCYAITKRGKKRTVINICMRSLCKTCRKRPCGINYYKDSKPYYRSQCDPCARDSKPKKPRWAQSGYKKKNICEKCGFKSKHSEQFDVFHLDGNLNNCRPANLKTVCANCQRTLQKEGVKWRQGDLIADF